MRLFVVLLLAVMGGLIPAVRAADDELQPTTEFGVTIQPDQIYDAIQETQDFWSPVRRQIVEANYLAADAATRTETALFFKQVNDKLHDRMFGGDEAQALDLIDYLSTRLRIFTFYRQLRSAMADDAQFVQLKATWDHGLRDANLLSGAERDAALATLIEKLASEMRALSLEPAKIDQVIPIWKQLAAAAGRLNATSAGQMMLTVERDAKAKAAATTTLIRLVADSADWALITKAESKLLKGSDFSRAWQELDTLRATKTARAPATSVGK